MKTNIHPQYYNDCVVTCACGNTFLTGSIKKEIKVEVCAACHPFFTGEQKFVDTEGRVDKFMRKRKEAEETAKIIKEKKEAKKKRIQQEKAQTRPKSLKELLEEEEQGIKKTPPEAGQPLAETNQGNKEIEKQESLPAQAGKKAKKQENKITEKQGNKAIKKEESAKTIEQKTDSPSLNNSQPKTDKNTKKQ